MGERKRIEMCFKYKEMSFCCDESFRNALSVNFEVRVPDHEKIEI